MAKRSKPTVTYQGSESGDFDAVWLRDVRFVRDRETEVSDEVAKAVELDASEHRFKVKWPRSKGSSEGSSESPSSEGDTVSG